MLTLMIDLCRKIIRIKSCSGIFPLLETVVRPNVRCCFRNISSSACAVCNAIPSEKGKVHFCEALTFRLRRLPIPVVFPIPVIFASFFINTIIPRRNFTEIRSCESIGVLCYNKTSRLRNTEQSGLKGGKYFCLQHFYMFKGGFLWI